ncbi:hypothetical protein VTJ83DRAFT_7277 [Remersonia thermophila]|uniref:Uncharacterized protein n=1 Tax=Remersonia thermophila TaxID=72144 RepID=A0ABR4D5D1_9PEZI
MRNAAAGVVNSLVFSPEEAKYLKAIFRWTDSNPSSDVEAERRRQQKKEEERRNQPHQTPAGELRILVLGAKGTGKTALLTRFAGGTFGSDSAPPDPLYEHGCRRPMELDEPDAVALSPPGTSGTAGTATTATASSTASATTAPTSQATSSSSSTRKPPKLLQESSQTYMLNVLEMPSKHLHSNPLLAHALSITEGAALLFSVRDEASLRLAEGLAEFLREHFAPPDVAEISGAATPPEPEQPRPGADKVPSETRTPAGVAKGSAAATPSSSSKHHPSRGRPYPILLVGTKADTLADPDPVACAGLSPSFLPPPAPPARRISYSQGSRTATKMPMPNVPVPTMYMETSAVTGEGVDEVFAVLGREVLRAKRAVLEQRQRAHLVNGRDEKPSSTPRGSSFRLFCSKVGKGFGVSRIPWKRRGR